VGVKPDIGSSTGAVCSWPHLYRQAGQAADMGGCRCCCCIGPPHLRDMRCFAQLECQVPGPRTDVAAEQVGEHSRVKLHALHLRLVGGRGAGMAGNAR
jgi:hypothetical protein